MGFLQFFKLSNQSKNLLARIFIGPSADTMYLKYNDILVPMYHEFYSGPENEESWRKRQDFCCKLNDMLEKRNANVDMPADFYDNVKPVVGSIVAAAQSERTTLSSQACRLTGNITKALGAEVHPFLDIILPGLISHCGSTKGVNQKNAHDAIMTVIQNAKYHSRILYHVTATFKDKRNPPRIHAPLWLSEVLRLYDHMIDVSREFLSIEKAIIAGLNDGQIKVRENTRITYWQYSKIHGNTAAKIMDGLNPHAAAALKEDPHNPDKPSKTAKQARSDSALAQIRSQNKQKLQQKAVSRNITPMSTQSADFIFGSIELPDASSAPPAPPASAPERPPPSETTKHQAKPSKSVHAKEKASETSRPLLSAPVRRARVVATPMAPPAQHGTRPASRDEPIKKSIEIKDRPTSSGRQTPIIAEDVATYSHALAKPTKESKDRITFQQTTQSAKKSATKAEEKHNLTFNTPQSGGKSPNSKPERPRSAHVLPIRHQKAPSTESQGNPRIEQTHHRTASSPHVVEGKENTYMIDRPIKNEKISRPIDSLEKARRSVTIAIEAIRNNRLDVLGYRKLKKLIENYPSVLITSHQTYDELYELLVNRMTSFEELTEPRELRATNLNHPYYNRYNIVNTLINLLRQYPAYGEPQPGMFLVALLKARGCHQDGHVHAVSSIYDAAEKVSHLQGTMSNPLPVIDSILDTLLELESLILNHDPITSPESLEQPLPATSASPFGDVRPKVPDRLPTVMSFGLHILTNLIHALVYTGQTLFDVQETRLVSLAQKCLATYSSIIKRQVMGFCTALHMVILPEKRFYSYFESETDRNLIHYYAAGAKQQQKSQGSLGKTGRVVPSSLSTMSSYQASMAGSEDSNNWEVLGTTNAE